MIYTTDYNSRCYGCHHCLAMAENLVLKKGGLRLGFRNSCSIVVKLERKVHTMTSTTHHDNRCYGRLRCLATAKKSAIGKNFKVV